jgi:hypothetical protein
MRKGKIKHVIEKNLKEHDMDTYQTSKKQYRTSHVY